MDILNNFSTREKNLWSEFLVDVVVALYYFPKLFSILRAGEEALTGRVMAELVTGTVILAIFVGIIVSVFLHTEKKPEQVDERDYLFDARGSKIAFTVLAISIALIMGNIVVFEMMPEVALQRMLFAMSPVAIANLLLVALMLSSMVKVAMQLFYYRRGY